MKYERTLGATTRPWASLSLERCLDGIAETGFKSVALPVHGIASPVTGNTSSAEVQLVGNMVTGHGLELSILSHEAALNRSDDEALQILLRQIDHCARLDVKILVDVGCQVPAYYERYLTMMDTAAPYAQDRGVTIAMKPHGGISRTIDDTVTTVERIGHPAFQVCLDPGLLIHHAGDSGLAGLGLLAPYVVAVGARDHAGRGKTVAARVDHGRDGRGMPPGVTPGEGIVDFDSMFQVLANYGFSGPVMLEDVRATKTVEETNQQVTAAHSYLWRAITSPTETAHKGTSDYTKLASTSARSASLDCSTLARSRGESPLGTARHFDSYLIVEIDVPWPRAMGRPLAEYPRLPEALRAPLRRAELLARKDGKFIKELAIDPDPAHSSPDHTRVMRFDVQSAPTGGYDKMEYLVPNDAAPALIEALYRPESAALEPFEPWRSQSNVRDLLVCTHGAVDACCGTYGYPLYQKLSQELDSDPFTRVWRASSFGGHRFAPTIVDLPRGRYWGNISPSDFEAILSQHGKIDQLTEIYRGSGAWSHPISQVAEAALFDHYGWYWNTCRLELSSLDDGNDEKRASLLAKVIDSQSSEVAYFQINIELIRDLDVTIGCTGLHGSVPIYEAKDLIPLDGAAAETFRELNLYGSVHAIRAGEPPH